MLEKRAPVADGDAHEASATIGGLPTAPETADFARLLLKSSKEVVMGAAANPYALQTVDAFSNVLEKNNPEILRAKAELARFEAQREQQAFKNQMQVQEGTARTRNRFAVVVGGLTVSMTGLIGLIGLAAVHALAAPVAVPLVAIAAGGLAVMGAAGTGQAVRVRDVTGGVAEILVKETLQKDPPKSDH